ncbi:MAG TPA: sigma-70 family RNA polymerase sigma factor [Acidobacteriota bacterium]
MEGSDAAAVAETLAGDEEAFAAVVQRHSRSLFRLAYRMTGNEHDAEEVVQETFLRAYRRLDQFEARANLSTWLYSIAVNCGRDFLQKHKRQRQNTVPLEPAGPARERENPSPELGPDRLALGSELGRRLNLEMDRLTAQERAALILRHYEGLSIAEIGSTLGLRPSATKNSIFRAVHKLRRVLGPVVGVRA